MQILIALVLNAAALLLTAYIVPGFHVASFTTAILAAIVLGVVNTFIKPILSFVSAPLTIVSLGLFTFVINAVVLFIVSAIVPGVKIEGWLPAILGAIVLSIASTILNSIFKDLGKIGK
ncbi:phage holin family protein [Candidatus Daviesbacteria bacterium]|nr:phage holin family protein [Candidatus Daviesbacteria bacterium]